jgi:glycogen operon protein
MSQRYSVQAGHAAPLGATPVEGGVNFAVFSANATQIDVCLFDETGAETRVPLPEREGDIWHGLIEGIGPGQTYGLRAHGPYRPDEGHRFNPNKLLIDPYARRLTGHPVWDDALMGFTVGSGAADLSFDTRDSVNMMPRSVVEDTDFGLAYVDHPRTALHDTVIYEAHVKGLTQRHPKVANPGTYAALASPAVLDHLTTLGVTAIELLPIHAFVNDRFLVDKGLTNYWGYQSIGFFAPDPRYLSGNRIAEVRTMVDTFHDAGIEVYLDVVYNHSGEGDHLGPTLAFRGLDNASYYHLQDDPRYYVNHTGTGNTLNLTHPMVLRMVLDSLRYWVTVMGVDGFRFDLCATLGRAAHGFNRHAPFFQAIRQDPILSRVKLIAEPWDIGPGGYQLGAFPPPFLEWNDKFRDGVRRFWRGDPGRTPDLAARITGSAEQFDHDGRRATASVNFVTAHDGFTLQDVVSYTTRRNEANGEDGRDGHEGNYSDNLGHEGPTDDPATLDARARRKRNMMATLLLSQGTPMILAGDELGKSQGGNNNAYNQDNETSWIDWSAADEDFLAFTRRMIAFRKAHPILRQKLFLHSRERAIDGIADLFWRRPDGEHMTARDWINPELKLVAVEMRTASGTPAYEASEYAIFIVFNAGAAATVAVPEPPAGQVWCAQINTADPGRAAARVGTTSIDVAAQSVAVLVLEPAS